MKKRTERPHIKAAARDATGVSTVRSGRRFCNFVGYQQLVEWAPVSGMPFCEDLNNPLQGWMRCMMQFRHIFSICGIVSLAFASTALAQGMSIVGIPIVEVIEVREPELEEESSVGHGEVIYAEFSETRQKAARLLEDIQVMGAINISKDQVLPGFSKEGDIRYCLKGRGIKLPFGRGAPTWICLIPSEGRSFEELVILGSISSNQVLSGLPSFEPTQVALSDNKLSELGLDKSSSRREILYQGAAGRILRLLYREYSSDPSIPDSTETITYDLPIEGKLIVSLKRVRIEVFEAGNSGIQYRVIHGFKE